MSEITNFLIDSVISSDPVLAVKASGILTAVDGLISITDSFTDLDFPGVIEDFTDLTISVKDLLTLEGDKNVLSTLFDPMVDTKFAPKAEDPTLETAKSTDSVDGLPPVPNSFYVEPIGNEPPLSYKGQYPHVNSYTTESGHLIEVDDTPGNERLLQAHKSGTYREINSEGRRVVKTVSSNYTIVAKDDHLYVEGSAEIYVKGNIKIICLNDATIDVAGRVEVNAGEDVRIKGKSIYLESTSGEININSAQSINQKAGLDITQYSGGETSIQSGSTISLQAEESISNKSAKISTESYGGVFVKSSGDVVIDSGSNIGLKAGNVISADGSKIKFQEGQSPTAESVPNIDVSSKAKKTGLGDAKIRELASIPSISEELVQGIDDDPDLVRQRIDEALSVGRITEEEAEELRNPPASDSVSPVDTKQGVNLQGTYTSTVISKLPDSAINGEMKISDNYKLCHFTNNRPRAGGSSLIAQGGLTKSKIAGNISLLAQNCVEKIRAKYPRDLAINSGFRQGSGKSQHLKGMAVDLTFGNKSKQPGVIIEIAEWIRDNVAFDQLIVEYGTSEIWIHISYDGTRKKQRGQVLTCRHPFASSVKYETGLIEYQWSPK